MPDDELLEASVAVVGHAEWVDFAVVPKLPSPGEILHAREHFELAAGGGAVAAVQMVKLCGAARIFLGLAEDKFGDLVRQELEATGVEVHAGTRPGPQRRAFTYLADDHERTITTMHERGIAHGEDPIPWELLEQVGGIYFTGGDDGALQAARRAGTIVATPRAGRPLYEAGVVVDVLVHSGKDPGERDVPAQIDPSPRTVVTTLGGTGGRWEGEAGEGEWTPAELPGPRVDSYGAGDSFAAGITVGLAAGLPIDRAIALGARCGAAVMTGRGPYAGQLDFRS